MKGMPKLHMIESPIIVQIWIVWPIDQNLTKLPISQFPIFKKLTLLKRIEHSSEPMYIEFRPYVIDQNFNFKLGHKTIWRSNSLKKGFFLATNFL